MVPRGVVSTGGVMMSWAQYRRLAETSPGSVKFGRVASAILCARPMPASSMPPHQTGMPAACAAACAHGDGLFGMVRRADAFVEADERLQMFLQFGMVDDVVMAERLLDHHEVELVQLLQVVDVGQGVGGVGVSHH